MNAYAGYVWAAYLVSIAGIAGLIVFTWAGWRKARRSLAARQVQDSETNL